MTDSTTTAQPPAGNAPQPAAQPEKPNAAPATLLTDDLLDEADLGDGDQERSSLSDSEADEGERPAWARPSDPEEATAWREEREIPLEPDGYLEVFEPPKGESFSEQGQETLASFAQVAHELDLSASSARQLVDFVAEHGRKQQAAMVEKDQADIAAAKQTLHSEWADQADSHLQSVKGLMKSLPADLSKALREARVGPFGSRLTNNPAFLQLLADYAALKAGKGSVSIFSAESDQKRVGEIRRSLKSDVESYYRDCLDQEMTKLLERQAARAPSGPKRLQADVRREQEIRKVMRSNYQKYKDDGLDVELTQILARRSA